MLKLMQFTQDFAKVLPRLLQCLHRLPNCSASSKGVIRWQTTLSTLFSSLFKVMCLENFPDAGRSDISQAVQQLLILAVEGPLAISSESQTNADMLAGLRGAVSLPHDNSAFLPILPDHAAGLLSSLLNKHMAPTKEGSLDNSHQLVVLLLAAQLCKAAFRGKSLDASLAHQLAAVACRSESALVTVLSYAHSSRNTSCKASVHHVVCLGGQVQQAVRGIRVGTASCTAYLL